MDFDQFLGFPSQFGNLGPDSMSDSVSSSSPQMMGDSNSLFPHDDFTEDGSFFFPEQYSDSLSVGTGDSNSPPQQTEFDASPLSQPSDALSIKQEGFVKPDSVEEESFDASSIVDMNSVASSPERKKQRRAPERKTRGKKRKVRSEDSVVMNMDGLDKKTPAEIESLIESLSAQGSLNSAEESRLRKIKRKVKNRESAQISRIRHRDHVECVEAELEYRKDVSEKWRAYALKLKAMMLANNLVPPEEPVIEEFVPPTPTDLSVLDSARSVMRPLRTAGFCLVMFVLSLGIVLNMAHHVGNSDKNKNSLVPVPTSASEPSARVIVDSSSAPLSQLPPTTNTVSKPPSTSESMEMMRRSTYLSYRTDKEDSSIALVIPSTKPSSTENALVPRTGAAVMPYTTKAIFGSSKPRLADRTWTLTNSSYILVKDASEFVPRTVDLDSVPARTEPVIGFLLPASSLNIPNLAPDDVVELVCGVRNATLVPRDVLARSLY